MVCFGFFSRIRFRGRMRYFHEKRSIFNWPKLSMLTGHYYPGDFHETVLQAETLTPAAELCQSTSTGTKLQHSTRRIRELSMCFVKHESNAVKNSAKQRIVK